ncbi:cytidine deaminase [Acrasis kona]|uniref:Cytidine deaminase n=1 Tax=Acrasis kona TaxID=1008807 RepID=A0AAW2Z619_9EUKA
MTNTITIPDETRDELVKLATEMREKAYAPYSKFLVGAAILGMDDKIYTGCNVENQSYGLTICAERTAAVKMVSFGCKEIKAVAVSTDIGTSPCGACRQFLCEFLPQNSNFNIYLSNSKNGQLLTTTMNGLLPQAVDLSFLKN